VFFAKGFRVVANPNPKTDQLALGRGKRPVLNNETVSMRLSPETRQVLEEIAYSYDCTYGGKPWIAGLLNKIGTGELAVVPTPPPKVPVPQQPFDGRQAVRAHLAQKYQSASSGASA
jgi:hypothetical protein